MAFTTADGTSVNLVNYQGKFLLTSNTQNPLLAFLGGSGIANGSPMGFRDVMSPKFAMSQTHALDAPSQPSLSETALKTAGSSEVNIPVQVLGYIQPVRHDVFISIFASANSRLSGTVVNGAAAILQRMAGQIKLAFMQIASDFEYCLHNGAYQDGSGSPATAYKMNGLLSACTSNIEAAGGAVFSKSMLDALLVTMRGNGADFSRLQLHCRLDLKQKISQAYGLAVRSTTIGGVALTTIETDSGPIDIVESPKVPANTIGLYDPNYMELVAFYPELDNGAIAASPLDIFKIPVSGLGTQSEIFGALGLDYGSETKHGKITNVVSA